MGHRFHDEECEMFDPKFLNTFQGPAKTSKSWQAPKQKASPRSQGQRQLTKSCSSGIKQKEKKVGGKEEVWVHKVHAFPFPKNHPNPYSTDLPARKKHYAVPPQLLNANPLAQMIVTETVDDIIINDAKACALLDSGTTADLMTLAYAEARNIRLMIELSDHFINLRLAARFKTTLSGYVEYNLQI